MTNLTETWTQDEFNEYVAKHDTTLTTHEVYDEAIQHDLNGAAAIEYAAEFPGGKYRG